MYVLNFQIHSMMSRVFIFTGTGMVSYLSFCGRVDTAATDPSNVLCAGPFEELPCK